VERSQIVGSPEVIETIIERPTKKSLRREMTWLVSPDQLVQKIMLRSGLIPASPDVDRMEHIHSIKSLQALAPILSEIVLTTELASDVVTDASVVALVVDEDDAQMERHKNRAVITQSAIGVLALLLDKGIIQIGSSRIVGG
jgi:hypothetical protein